MRQQLYKQTKDGTKVPIEPIIECNDTLTGDDSTMPLSARMGKLLNENKPDLGFITRDGCHIISIGNVVMITFNRYIAGSVSNEHIITSPVPGPMEGDGSAVISMTFNGKPYEVFVDGDNRLMARLCQQGETFGTDRIAGIFAYIRS